ncbi:MAG: hypothetical protein P8Y27_18565 [Chromatiaceae bacterium]|jgi:hypothetical protein
MSTVPTPGIGPTQLDDPIRTAKDMTRGDRAAGLAALNSLFREGQIPEPPPDGPYKGELVAVDIAPAVSRLVEGLASLWMPWKGKFLIRAQNRGDNIFSRGSRMALRILFPFYRGMSDYEPDSFRAFVFQTSIAAGMVDRDRQVFRIDYDRPDNPALSIRRIVDEIVQVREGVYLGKIHFKWWWGRWAMIGYFALRRRD